MDTPLIALRKKLSIIATIIVFLITLCVGVGFISYQYWRAYQGALIRMHDYEVSVTLLPVQENQGKDFKNDSKFSALFQNFFLLLDRSGGIQYNYSPYSMERNLREIFRETKNSQIQSDDGYLYSRFSLEDGSELVAIVWLGYSEQEYARDMGEYAGFVSLVGVAIYFILLQLIGYILRPIAENIKTMQYFVQVAGHELKTPLTAILSSTQLLQETKKYDQEIVDDIENETQKAGELIGSLAELSSMSDRAPKEEVHLTEILYEVLRLLDSQIRAKKLNIRVELINDTTLEVNRYYLNILISNLLSNAIKYNIE